MKTSREQFEEWFSPQKDEMKRNGLEMIAITRMHQRQWSAWQASRQCIEVELPEPFSCYQVETGKLYYDDEVVSAMSNAGIKIKGA